MHVAAALADAAVEFVGAVGAVDVAVAAPVVRDAALHVALEASWTHCQEESLSCITHKNTHTQLYAITERIL